MRTPFSVLIDRLEILSALANSESNYSQNLIVGAGQPLDFGSAVSQQFMSEPSPCAAALSAFLDALPAEVIYAFTALMYSGRDEEPDAVDLWENLKSTIQSKEQAHEAITEKYRRMEYIRRGVTLLPPGTILDMLPASL